MRYRKSVLSMNIVAALMFGGVAIASTVAVPSSGSSIGGEHLSEAVKAIPNAQTDTQANQQKTAKSGAKKTEKVVQLHGIKVTGLVQSQEHSIQLKRHAADIQDSITAVSIGQLPDITITDSLQRIPGVQIDRSAGEGTSINIRGLPEVRTLINGGAFISASNVYGIQPNFQSLPGSLFAGVDVIKSSRANLTASGISGTINLRTRRPWGLPFGMTVAGTVEGGRGSVAKKTKPEANVLVGYNAGGRWGILIAASHSDFIHSFNHQGWQNAGGTMGGENSSAVAQPNSYVTGWSGSPLPPQIKRLPDGGVDVNGDGKSNGAFYSQPRLRPSNKLVQPKRTGLEASFQAALGNAFTLTADAFYTHQIEYTEIASLYTLPVSQTAPTSLPLVDHNTGVVLTNPFNTPGVAKGNWHQNFYTVQKYNIEIGDWEPESIGTDVDSIAKNYDVDLKFNNGGRFTGNLRFIGANASQESNSTWVDMTQSDGAEWHNVLKPGVSIPRTVYPVPKSISPTGLLTYNPNGYHQYSFAAIANFEGKNPTVQIQPESAMPGLGKESNYRLKSAYGSGSIARSDMHVLRFDGKYRFSDQFSVDFGLKDSIRTASLRSYDFAERRYAGDGASDPKGCLVRWTTSDIVIGGSGIAGACTAGNKYGFFRGNLLLGPITGLPDIIKDNMIKIVNPGKTTGVVAWNVNPRAMRNAKKFYGTEQGHPPILATVPASSWNVLLKNKEFYAQANFKGQLDGHDVTGNFGVRVIRTGLNVTQNLTGLPIPYGMPAAIAGRIYTNRHYLDILPSINVAINLKPDLVLRLAESKNMMPLSLNEWGGGFSRSFSITTLPNGQQVQGVNGASSGGNPNLKPWRSNNFGTSLEWYIGKDSILSVSAFRIRVASFIESSSVETCDIPDEDGVVRRCVPLSEPVQGTGQTLHGGGANYRQSLTFLPGFLSHTGFDVNGTYSPSNTGVKDMAGHDIPFPDNSKYEGNAVVWFQNSELQVRVAGNYRSTRAVSSNLYGITGFEVYQKPTIYLDASVSYQVTPHIQIFAQGQNLTNERQQFYIAWPDFKFHSNLSEEYYFLGVRVHL